MHALTDAILGAIGGGRHRRALPALDQRWKGAGLGVFLNHALDL